MEILLDMEVTEFLLQDSLVVLVECVSKSIVLHVMTESRYYHCHLVEAGKPCNLINALFVDHETEMLCNINTMEIIVVMNVPLVSVVHERHESDVLLRFYLSVNLVDFHELPGNHWHIVSSADGVNSLKKIEVVIC